MTTLISIATIPGRELALEETLASLEGQGATIMVYDGSEAGDAAKFNGPRMAEADYYFVCDDDVIYPPDYVEHMIAKVEEYDRKCAMTIGGKRFGVTPITSYYRGSTAKYHALSTIASDEVGIDVPLTCSLVWHRDTITFPESAFKDHNMADIWAGVHCRKMGVPCVVVAHDASWIRLTDKIDHYKDTIWAWEHEQDEVQTGVINREFA